MEELKELEVLIGALSEKNESVMSKADGLAKMLAPSSRQWNDAQSIITTATTNRIILRCMRDVIAEARGGQ